MTTDRLLDYVLDQLAPADRRAVEAAVAADPSLADRLNRLNALLAPLRADRAPDAPPPELALAALARTAEHAVAHGLFTADRGFSEPPTTPAEPERARWRLTRGQVNAAVAATAACLIVAFALAGVQKVRRSAQVLACADGLRGWHAALAAYSEAHGGRFPQAGTPAVPTAGDFAAELARGGQLGPTPMPSCPVVPASTSVGYAYSLGYVAPGGRLVVLWKPDTADDLTPILADLPPGENDGPGPHGGWNVLCVGGAVRLTTSTVLAGGDDLFRNDAGLPKAGLHLADTSLGRPFDRP